MTTVRKATLEFTPDDHVTCWQKRDGERTLQVGEFEIDMPIDTARALHGELASGLGLACRPRSVQEQLAGHSRAALDLITDPALGDLMPIAPEQIVVTVYNKPGDEGAVYTLRDPKGEEREITDGDDDYMVLADVIDRAYGDLPPTPPAQSAPEPPGMEVWVLATEDDGVILTSVHASEQDAMDALRTLAKVSDDVEDGDLITHVREDVEIDLDVSLEGHLVRFPIALD